MIVKSATRSDEIELLMSVKGSSRSIETITGNVAASSCDLLSRISRDDAIAFEKLYYLLCSSLKKFVISRGAGDLTDDIVQETYCRVWELRTRFVKKDASAKTYVFGIALNILREHKRRARRVIRLGNYMPRRLIAVDAHSATEIKELYAALAAAKAVLSESQRDDIRSIYECGKSISEVAAERVVSAKAVRCRLDRAYRRMHELLARKHLGKDPTAAKMFVLSNHNDSAN